MTRTRARRLTRTILGSAALALTITGGILTSLGHPAWAAITLATAVALVFTGWLIGTDPHAAYRGSPPRPYEDWRQEFDAEIEVAKFRSQISAWEAERRSGK